MMHYIVNVSGGLTSYEALRRCLDAHGTAQTTAVFADTLIEDEDLYRFLADQERYFGIEIVRLRDGRTPWQVMRDERYITLRSVAPCSRILKQQVVDHWLAEHAPAEYTCVFGFDWSELHRVERIAKRLAPVPVWCPLTEPPYVTKAAIMAQLMEVGITPPHDSIRWDSTTTTVGAGA